MYINVVSFKNGHTVAFKTEAPFSVDQMADNWNLITDKDTGYIISFKGSEVVTIASKPVTKGDKLYPRNNTAKRTGKKPAIKTAVTTE